MVIRELAIFLIVGVTTVVVDFLTYRGIVNLELAGVDAAKAIGFLVGTVFAYFANRFLTFGHKSQVPGTAWRFVILYAGTLVANVVVNSLILKILKQSTFAVNLAFFMATGFSAILNFLGMKFFVFHSQTAEKTQ